MLNNYLCHSKIFQKLISQSGLISEYYSRNHLNFFLKLQLTNQVHNISIQRQYENEVSLGELNFSNTDPINKSSNNIYNTLLSNFHASLESFLPDNNLLYNNFEYFLPIMPNKFIENDSSLTGNIVYSKNALTKNNSFVSIREILNNEYNGEKNRKSLKLLDEEVVNIYYGKENLLLQFTFDELNKFLLPPINKLTQDFKRSKSNESNDLPSLQQLSQIKNILIEEFPRLLKSKHRFDIYTDNIIFENNWIPDRSHKTIGIWNYGIELIKFRLLIYSQLSNAEMNIINVDENIEKGTVELRWRIIGIKYLKTLMFWKLLSPEDQEWLDGISLFYINSKGLIFRHIMHKMINEGIIAQKKSLINKLTINIPLPVTN